MDMQIPMDAEMDKYPHVFITADSPWDPSVLDNEFEDEFSDAVAELPEVKERCNGADPHVEITDSCNLIKITRYFSVHKTSLLRPTQILLPKQDKIFSTMRPQVASLTTMIRVQ